MAYARWWNIVVAILQMSFNLEDEDDLLACAEGLRGAYDVGMEPDEAAKLFGIANDPLLN